MSIRDYNLNGLDSIMYEGELSQVQAVQNLDNAYIGGVQVGVKIELPYNLELNSKINYQKGEEYDGSDWSPLRHAAPLFGSTKLNWKYSKLNLEFFANYNGSLNNSELALSELKKPHLYSINNQGSLYFQSWLSLNIRASYSFNESLVLFLGLDNLTDLRYMTYSSGIVAPGRSINASINYKF